MVDLPLDDDSDEEADEWLQAAVEDEGIADLTWWGKMDLDDILSEEVNTSPSSPQAWRMPSPTPRQG